MRLALLFASLCFANLAYADAVKHIQPLNGSALLSYESGIFLVSRCDGEKLCKAKSSQKVLDEAMSVMELASGLPESRAAILPNGTVQAAWYTRPTDRYAHAVLGDRLEGGGLKLIADDKTYELVLAENRVFEDIVPRLADLNGDGKTEIITIQSSVTAGAAVVIYGLEQGKIVQLAQSDFIGSRNRWLNIAGIADYLGDEKSQQIIWVETPHIGGKLHIGIFDGTKLNVKGPEGFEWPRGNGLMSNHAIGSRNQSLSITADSDGDKKLEMILPGQDRKGLWLVKNGKTVTKIGALPRSFQSNLAYIPFNDSVGGTLIAIDDDGALMTFNIQ